MKKQLLSFTMAILLILVWIVSANAAESEADGSITWLTQSIDLNNIDLQAQGIRMYYIKELDQFSIHLQLLDHDSVMFKMNEYYMVDRQTGKEITADEYDCVYPFSDGLALVEKSEGNFVENIKYGYIHVKHGLALVWGKTPEQLLQQAIGNIDVDEVTVSPLLDVINDMLQVKYRAWSKEDEAPAPIFMLSNGEAHGHGASVLVSEQIRKKLCERFGQDMYVLPSSVHEMMLVPASGKVSAQELQQLVRNTNRECVPAQERLSDSVYLLHADDASVTIAAKG